MARSDLTGELRSNSSRDPIYEQIARQIRTQIIAGNLPDGTPLPSMRKLADELRISVITTKRAFEELEQEGFIDTVEARAPSSRLRTPTSCARSA